MSAIRTQAFLGQQIAGYMFFDELVIGHVLVERSNHVIAISPGIQFVIIKLVTVGLSEAH